MKIKLAVLGSSLVLSFFTHVLSAHKPCEKAVPVGWIDCKEVHMSEDAFYIDTNLGTVEITVIDYDEEKKRYLVECIKYGDFFYPTPEESLR